jgi:multidrug resistance protein, MATE family
MTELSPATPTSVPAATGAPARGSLRELVLLGTPLVLTQLSQTLMGIVDSAFVGRLGAAELGAVAFANIWSWTIFSLFLGSASAVQTFVSQAQGGGDERRCGLWAWQGFWAVAPATALAALAAYLATPAFLPEVLRLVGAAPELAQPAVAYLQPRAIGMIALGVVFVWNNFYRGVGLTTIPLAAGLVANLANALGDYALIFGHFGAPRLGVAGAAIATAASEFLYAAIVIGIALRPSLRRRFATRPQLPSLHALRRLARTGVPIGAQWVFDGLSFAVFTLLLSSMSAAAVAASHSFIMLVNVSFMIALGVSGATQTLVGRAIGSSEPELAVTALKNGLRVALTFSAALAVGLTAAPTLLMRIFTNDPDVLALGVGVLRLGAVFQLLDAVHIVVMGALRGAGDTTWPAAWQTALAWLVFLPLAWLFGRTLGHGLVGAYAGGTVYVALLAGGLLWRFASGKWRSVRI